MMDKKNEEKKDDLEVISNLEQDEFEYSPYENFVNFELINDPKNPKKYIVILKLYAPANKNTVYSSTVSARGDEIRHFNIGTNPQINELLMKSVTIKPEFAKTQSDIDKYVHALRTKLTLISNTMNDYIIYLDELKEKEKEKEDEPITPDEEQTTQNDENIEDLEGVGRLPIAQSDFVPEKFSHPKKAFLGALDLYHLMDDNYKVSTDEDNPTSPKVKPYNFEPMSDGQMFDRYLRNYNVYSYRLFNNKYEASVSNADKSVDNGHFYNPDMKRTISFRKQLKRIFPNKRLDFDVIVEVPDIEKENEQDKTIAEVTEATNKQNKVDSFIESLKSQTYPPEEINEIENNKQSDVPSINEREDI
ncbi:MAG: hypothetical protein IJ809_06490 [Clostridia bacterium]|nr:hypothetical protein [Clostridia bacterium]